MIKIVIAIITILIIVLDIIIQTMRHYDLLFLLYITDILCFTRTNGYGIIISLM